MSDNIRIHSNASCVECDVVLKEMVRVGAIVLCSSCFKSIFKTKNPVRDEREKYLALLKKSEEKN